MPLPGAVDLLPFPGVGRSFEAGRRVRLADVAPSGRARLDAMVRYLQDVARDDYNDLGLKASLGWVVRRTKVDVGTAPRFEEWIDIDTWCSGLGGRWAERRTTLRGEWGAEVEAVSLWVCVDTGSGRPVALRDDFLEIFGPSADGRRIGARGRLETTPGPDAEARPWAVRKGDLDMLGHVNNAAHWVPVEEALAESACWADLDAAGFVAELEHGPGVERGPDVVLRWVERDGGVDTWLCADGVVGSAARVRPR